MKKILLLLILAGFMFDCSAKEEVTVTVNSVEELVQAIDNANQTGYTVIELADGAYQLDEMLYVTADHVTVRSQSGNREDVEIRGQGMNGDVTHVFLVAGKNFTAADMTIGWVANHAVQIQGEENANNPRFSNIRFVDTGEQMLKVSYTEGDKTGSDEGLVEDCLFEYTEGYGPQYYIGGIDVHQGDDWVVRDNRFQGIRSPEEDLAEHAIHFWSDSKGTVVERNLITNCDRGIGFGLGDRGHEKGIIRNNMVHTTRDVGIGLENSEGSRVYNNSVYTENYENSIEYRFSGSSDVSIINNLCSAAIVSRDGGSGSLQANVIDAQSSWFVDPVSGDLHLAGDYSEVIDRGETLTDVSDDIDGAQRLLGDGYDIGADEYQ